MKNIKRMLECRALFLQTIAHLSGQSLNLNENFSLLLDNFLENHFQGNEDYFNLIYYFDTDDEGNLSITEDPEWDEELNKYLNYFTTGNHNQVIALYNDIGYEDTNKISVLAEQFLEHLIELNDLHKSRFKS